jgi:hypothetical protein
MDWVIKLRIWHHRSESRRGNSGIYLRGNGNCPEYFFTIASR